MNDGFTLTHPRRFRQSSKDLTRDSVIASIMNNGGQWKYTTIQKGVCVNCKNTTIQNNPLCQKCACQFYTKFKKTVMENSIELGKWTAWYFQYGCNTIFDFQTQLELFGSGKITYKEKEQYDTLSCLLKQFMESNGLNQDNSKQCHSKCHNKPKDAL